MDTGRTTSIPVGHFRKEQADGGHAAADPRWWCMRCSEWLGVRGALCWSKYCAMWCHSKCPNNVTCVQIWMVVTRVCYGVEDHHKKRTKGVATLRLVSGLYFYSFRSVSFSSHILCHSCPKIVWFVTYFSGCWCLKWCVRLYAWAVLESLHRGLVSYSTRDTLYDCDVKICYNRSSFFKLECPYESAEKCPYASDIVQVQQGPDRANET